MQQIYTTTEAAKVAGVSQRTVTKWIREGRLKAKRAPGRGRPAWRIQHDDLMAAAKGVPLFAIPEPAMPLMELDDPDSRTMDATSISVVFPLEERAERFSLDLFNGYDRLRAVTYSVSLPMIHRLLTTMDYSEFSVIFGDARLVNATMADILTFQQAVEREVSQAFLGIGGVDSDRAQAIIDRIVAGKGEFRAMKDKVVHSKIYLLEGKHGRRVMLGSANMSEVAFSGRQGEIMMAFDDNAFMWEKVQTTFADLRELATSEISLMPTTHASIINIEQVGLFKEAVEKKQPAKVYVPADNSDNPGSVERLGVLMNAAYPTVDLALADAGVKPDTSGIVSFTPAIIERVKKNAALALPQDTSEQQTLQLHYKDGRFVFNGRIVERPMEYDPIRMDAHLITEYINNYSNFGSGADNMQADYFTLMAWMYFTPFVSRVRQLEIAAHNPEYRGHTKLAALLYGESHCGKTNVVQLLFTSMFGAYQALTDSDFTPRPVSALQMQTGLFPLFYDDIQKKRFAESGTGTNIIKSLDHMPKRATEYPCIVASLNHDTYELPASVRKRCLPTYTDTPLPSDDTDLEERMERSANAIHNRVNTAFFREYLYRMNDMLSDNPDDYDRFDYLDVSSRLLVDMFKECLGPDEMLPDWCTHITSNMFNGAFWGSKRVVVDRNLDQSAYDGNFPPGEGRWTLRDNDLVIGVNSFHRKALSDRLPAHIINSAASRGETIYLHADKTIDFMRRGERWKSWKIPTSRTSLFKRLTFLGRR